MIPGVRMLPAAESDVEDAADWYEDRSPELGDIFFLDLVAELERIVSRPRSCQVLRGSIRRGVVRRFPFVIYYRVESSGRDADERIVVLAVFHTSRNPTEFEARLEEYD